jgi:hypothetical protein
VSADGPLVCPSCAAPHPLDERFCARCGTPLVYAPGATESPPITAAHERARKIKPQYAEGELIRVAGSRNLTEAEFIQGLLLEEGVPSLLRRTRGFDVPDFLAAGPRDVLVPAAGADAAHEILLDAEVLPRGSGDPLDSAIPSPLKLLAGLLLAFGVVGAIAWAISGSV